MLKAERAEIPEIERLKMTGELKGNKKALTEMLDVIRKTVKNAEGKMFWLKFSVEGADVE